MSKLATTLDGFVWRRVLYWLCKKHVLRETRVSPAADYTLQQLIDMAERLGADFSAVPGVR